MVGEKSPLHHNHGGNIDAPVARLPWEPPRSVHPENQHQADFFCGKLNGITFPYCSGGIHFVTFFVKLLGTKNSMIFAINHPTCKNKSEAKKFLILTNLYRCLQAVSPEDIGILSVIADDLRFSVGCVKVHASTACLQQIASCHPACDRDPAVGVGSDLRARLLRRIRNGTDFV
jgi:hypothetical protein